MAFPTDILAEVVATLLGIFVGTLSALMLDRLAERRRLRRQAGIVLRSLAQELSDNARTLQNARPIYASTPWGKSFYVSTVAWETALSGGDLPRIVGFELADRLAAQYALLARIRYYVDLLTRLWFAPSDVPGYEEIRHGFHQAILETMSRAIRQHSSLMGQIQERLS